MRPVGIFLILELLKTRVSCFKLLFYHILFWGYRQYLHESSVINVADLEIILAIRAVL